MNKLDMETKDIVNDNIERVKDLFPGIVSEDGIDFDLLKQELSSVIIDEKKEKYQLTWPGKKNAILNSNSKITKTLRPIKDKSVKFEKTKNIYIEGDNLEVLKILQESYLNKIKCIYIDPPYNTGNDFIYNDNFNNTSEQELIASGQKDENGYKLVSNSSSNGKFHSDWLSMMYSRLKLSRNLLTNDGLIFISIDDNELYNLKKVCDEIFGENNFINCITIKMSELSGVKMKHLKKYPKLKESLLIYAKDNSNTKINVEKRKKSGESLKSYLRYYSSVIENPEDSPENWKIVSIKEFFDKNKIDETNIDVDQWKIENSDRVVYRTNSRTVTKFLEQNPNSPSICRLFNSDGNEVIKWNDKEMLFLNKYVDEYLGDIWVDISTINLNKETDIKVYENGQKPLLLIERILNSIVADFDEEIIVMDYFSGSSTTAHAVMDYNLKNHRKYRYIMVQIPDEISEKSDAYKSGFRTLCDIGEARIRNASQKLKEESNGEIDYGFRVFKVDSSNMKDVYYKPSDTSQLNLLDYISNIKDDRTREDLLIQVMLDLGLTLDLKIEERLISNNKVYYVENNSLVACFDDQIDINIVDEICKCNPMKVVFKDTSFKTDKDKINLEEKIKKLSPDTEVSVL